MKTLQSEIMKALEDAKCLDPESENWSYHTASRIAADVASQFREPSSPDKIDEAISYFEEIKSERESKKEDDTVLINYVLIILKSIKQRSHDRTNVSIKANEDAIIVNGKRYVKESETGEQEELIELVSLAFHAMGKIRSEPTMSGTKFYPIPKEYEILSGKFYDKLDAFCGKYRTLVDSITRKPLDR